MAYDTGWLIWSTTVEVCDIAKDGVIETLCGNRRNCLYCLDDAGKLKWRFDTGGDVDFRGATGDVDGDDKIEIVIASKDYYVYCLENGS